MTLSDLETELKALDASLSTLSTRLTVLSYILIFCTAVVVAGLVVEYTADFREWATGRPRDRRKRWPTRVGALLVILGVTGEVGFTFWSFKVESEIKSTNSNIERVLKKEIQMLGISATEAAGAADRANELVDKIGKSASATARQLQTAEERERQQESKTEAAQKELNRLLFLFARRSGERVLDTTKFRDLLIGKPKRTVIILYKPDTEPQRFADDLYRVLDGLHWPVLCRPFTANEKFDDVPLDDVQGIMLFSSERSDILSSDNFGKWIIKSMLFGGGVLATLMPQLAPNTLVVVIGSMIRM